MRFLAFLTAFLFSVGVYAQPAAENVLSGTYNILTATPTGSADEYSLTGFFNDLGGVYFPSQVAAGQIVWDQMGQRFVIESKSTNSPLAVVVTALNPGDFPETGIGCIVVETNDFPPLVAGVSGVLQAKIDNHFKQVLEPGGGGDPGGGTFKEQYWTLQMGTTLTITAGTPPGDAAKIDFYRNGLLQRPGVGQDYTLSGTTITLAVSAQSTEVFRIVFIE